MALTAVLVFLSALGPVTAIRLDENGYTDILIVINPRVQENEELLNQTKEMIINGSDYLFEALDHKVFFKEVKILVPPNWMTGKYERARNESYEKGKIRIDNPHPSFGDDPYTRQTGDCGEEGDYIHFTPNFLLNNDLMQVYGPRGRVFVHEWAHLRWGVFDEYNKKEPFYKKLGNILPTSCTDKISGQWYEISNQQTQPCRFDANGEPTSSCEFLPDKVQNTNASIMYLQSLESVKAFCQEREHNIEAPNEQNTKCSYKATRTVIFQDSEDKDALQILKPFPFALPTPTFKIIQRGSRVVCLVLDVSGSMHGSRIGNQRRSATVLLNQCIKEKETVGIVTFSTEAQVLSPLTLIDGQATKDSLINKLPEVANGYTYICKGLRKGLELLRSNDKTAVGDEIFFLTDGEATDNVGACLQEAVDSGAVIHTIAFGTSADPVLQTMAVKTGGVFKFANESVVSNELLDAFCSITMFDGNPITQLIQLESTAKNVADWFNGTVPIDRTVGNHTAFTITHERSAPIVYIKSPSGLVYDQSNTSSIASTITFTVPGTAEPGDWKYSFLNEESTAQAIGLMVMSRAAREDVHPVTVTARMNQQTSDGTKPMVVLAEVSQNYNPVVGATVWANLASDTGHSVQLKLLDNGAGADAFKDDGVYSRYFTKLKFGKYSLKVRVENQHGGIQLSSRTHSGALYVPGYIVDGQVELNPPKPTINVPPADVGSFTRTITGESFVVEADGPSNFPPNKITDLTAEMQEGIVLLNWTAPGEDFDEGKAQSYEIRWSEDLKTLQNNFNSTNLVNTSALVPQESGSREHHSFKPNITIQNGTTFFFAVETLDQQSAKSEISNIARATNYAPSPRPPPISNPGLNLTAIIVSVCTVAIVACVLTVVITCALKKKRRR